LWLVPSLAILVVVVAAAAGTVPAAVAGPVNPSEPVPTERDDTRAILLLENARRAASRVAYSGVQYVAAWCKSGSASQVVDVRHVPGIGSLVAVHGTSFREDNAVFTADGTTDGVPDEAVAVDSVSLLVKNYSVVLAGREEVAGRPAHVVEVRRPSGSVAARFWLDRETGLVLRREVFDSHGATTKASAFVDFTVGHATLAGRSADSMPAAWPDTVPISAAPSLRDVGWTAPAAVASNFELIDVRQRHEDGRTAVHLTYSDGLSTVSVFQDRGHLDAQRLDGFEPTRVDGAEVYVSDGIPYQATWSADGVVYTVLGDAPDDAMQTVIAFLPHEQAPAGVMARLSRGMDRVASWFNPFG
jgi:sigma-E factor negative regulatory protein RseB